MTRETCENECALSPQQSPAGDAVCEFALVDFSDTSGFCTIFTPSPETLPMCEASCLDTEIVCLPGLLP